ncbi:hypothetical protein BJ170DRAFT_496497 [Xylariales sp. AK1849]|nr:hypothetical protein BJ170DRAFT_496497 [Xylariales sp. AK1849]
MEPPPMILPKGIVLNTDRVYKEVATYPTVPPEKIYEYWHVYTTTFNKLKDPTASRLENFWWHVMGSDRRFLSGPTLAKLFEDISNGPTFVRLRGPPNRYEGPSSPPIPIAQNAPTPGSQAVTRETRYAGQLERKTDVTRPIQSSSSKPPPVHPILKKPRGPSASGPRPTARFVSPPQTEGEDDNKESAIGVSATAVTNAATDLKAASNSTTKERQKKSAGNTPKKKSTSFVASSATKRRPAMPRRPSSQSSTGGSEVGSREGSSSLSLRYLGSQRPVSPIAERPHKGATSMSQHSDERPSTKAAGKRPAVQPASMSAASESKCSQAAATELQEKPVVVQAGTVDTQQHKITSRGQKEEPIYEVNRTREAQTGPPHRRNDAHKGPRAYAAAPTMVRSSSDIGTVRPDSREANPGRRGPPQGLLSSSTATTSNIAAQGTIIDFDESAPARAVASAMHAQQESSETGLRRSGSTVTLTPTAPSNTPTVPLGRSKSQLTLLLERQSEKKPRR